MIEIFNTNFKAFLNYRVHIQGYPQRMRIYRRLYGIYTVRFFTLMVPCNCKRISFFAKSLNKPNLRITKALKIVVCSEFQVVFALSFFKINPAVFLAMEQLEFGKYQKTIIRVIFKNQIIKR